MRIKDGNLDIGMLRHHLGEVSDIVETSRVPTLDATHPEVDELKSRIEGGLKEVQSAATALRRLDRKRRREEPVAVPTDAEFEDHSEKDPALRP
jgi:hypothetical protein